jgi:SSS family solute:Na+ symporter
MYMWSSVGFLIRVLIPDLWGIAALAYVTADPALHAAFFPAPGAPAAAVNNLYAVPVFLGRILPVGLLGLLLAGMLAAEMSTHDSYLLTWSSVLTQDVVGPLTGERMGPRARILLTRVFMFLIGVYLIWWGLVYHGREDLWDYMAVSGSIYFTGAFALLAGGLYWKGASAGGALLALACGGSAVLGLTPVQDALGIHPSSAQVGLSTVGLTLAAMVGGSLVFPRSTGRRR